MVMWKLSKNLRQDHIWTLSLTFFVIFIFLLKNSMPQSCCWKTCRLSGCACLVTCLLAYQNSRTAFFWITRELCNECFLSYQLVEDLGISSDLVQIFRAPAEESHVVKLVWISQMCAWSDPLTIIVSLRFWQKLIYQPTFRHSFMFYKLFHVHLYFLS